MWNSKEKTGKEQIIDSFEKSCNDLAMEVNKSLFRGNEEFFWVGNQVGDLCCYTNMVALSTNDMILILKENISCDEVLKWWEDSSKDKPFLNLKAWHMGLRHEMMKKQS